MWSSMPVRASGPRSASRLPGDAGRCEGFVLKDVPPGQLISAVRAVAEVGGLGAPLPTSTKRDSALCRWLLAIPGMDSSHHGRALVLHLVHPLQDVVERPDGLDDVGTLVQHHALRALAGRGIGDLGTGR